MFLDPIIRPVSYAQVEKAYRRAMGPGSKSRSIYCQVFGKAIEALKQLDADPIGTAYRRNKILNDNLALWEAMIADLRTMQANVDKTFFGRMLSLKVFVVGATKQIKATGSTVAPLIEINESVLDGLAGITQTPQQALSTPTPNAPSSTASGAAEQSGAIPELLPPPEEPELERFLLA